MDAKQRNRIKKWNQNKNEQEFGRPWTIRTVRKAVLVLGVLPAAQAAGSPDDSDGSPPPSDSETRSRTRSPT